MHRRSIAAILALLCAPLATVARAQSLETALMPGQVIQGHAKYESECKRCHVGFNRAAQTQLCLDCHKDVARDVAQRRGLHGRETSRECRACHTDHKGRTADIAPVNTATFDHKQTDFVLKGGHLGAKAECRACHVAGKKYRDAPSDCNACHKKDDRHEGKLGSACADCHTEANWKQTRFDHGKTRFALRNAHADVPCKNCHVDPGYKGAPLECVSCHQKDDKDKGHQGRFGKKCETCHSDRNWKTTTFSHERATKYALHGKHNTAKCVACHKGMLYEEKLATTCATCHKGDDEKKGHKGRFGEKCESCHTEKAWDATTFNHDRGTKYPLKGRHAQAKCVACHTGFLYQDKLRSACVACHHNDDMKKGHQGKFGEKCESCHNERDWKTNAFNHDRDTDYPLRGKHAQAKCNACHIGGLYQDKLATSCVTCHRKDDVHKDQLGPKCESCHNEQSWKQTRFDHGLTRFPLLGGHAGVKCKECHTTQHYKDAKVQCYACHVKADKHKQRLGTQCQQCHNVRSWKEWDFDHDRNTSFKLDGKHRGLACLACHRFPVQGRAVLPDSCASCHDAQDVHHGGFGRQCERCHVTSSFKTVKPGSTGRFFQ